jgi:hypothetical protein
LLYTATGQQLFVDSCVVPSETIEAAAALMNTTSSFGAGTSLASGASRSFWIPIWLAPWTTSAGIFMPGFTDDLLVRVSFVPQAQIVESGASPNLNLTAAYLRMSCSIPDLDEHKRLMAEYRTGVKDFRFLHSVIQSVSQSFTASTTYNIQLSAMVGLCAWVHFFARGALSTSPNPRTFTNLVESFEFKDQAGKNINGGNIVRADFAKAFLVPYWFPGQSLHTNLNINTYAFCSSPQIVSYSGAMKGYQTLEGVEQLSITTPAGLTTATYQLDIIGYFYSILRIEKGTPVIMNS